MFQPECFSLAVPQIQGSFFWLQNTEGDPVVGGWLQIHQPQVLPPYFAARKKNPAQICMYFLRIDFRCSGIN
jgi:hypothetical protein